MHMPGWGIGWPYEKVLESGNHMNDVRGLTKYYLPRKGDVRWSVPLLCQPVKKCLFIVAGTNSIATGYVPGAVCIL